MTTDAVQLPNEIAGWICQWQRWTDALELAFQRKDRRQAALGESVAGRVVVTRRGGAWQVEARLWVLEDLAEHQRLRVRRGTARTGQELQELLVDSGVPTELADQLVRASA